jgi:hypothetical protein
MPVLHLAANVNRYDRGYGVFRLTGVAAPAAGTADLLPGYSTRITRPRSAGDWNVPHSGVGCVTRVQVRESFVDGYKVHQVGGLTTLEYWISAEDLPDPSANIIGAIEAIAECAGRPAAGIRLGYRPDRRPGHGSMTPSFSMAPTQLAPSS